MSSVIVFIGLTCFWGLLFYFYRVARILNRHGGAIHYETDVTLDGKTALITGANSGIGKETAVDFARRGCRVVLACRDLKTALNISLEIRFATGNTNIVPMRLDLSDLESVQTFAQEYIRNEKRLDILINNAGIGVRTSEQTKQNFDQFFGVNYLGHFLLTYLLLDTLKKSAPSRIVTLSSYAHVFVKRPPRFDQGSHGARIKYPDLSGYAKSKLCNILHSRMLANILRDDRVCSNSVHPGMVKTDILRKNPLNGKGFIKLLAYRFLFRYFGRSAEDGAKIVVYVATDKSLNDISGQYFENINVLNKDISQLAQDDVLAEELWYESLKMCQDFIKEQKQ